MNPDGPGRLLRVPFQSPMSIGNESKERLGVFVIKAPILMNEVRVDTLGHVGA